MRLFKTLCLSSCIIGLVSCTTTTTEADFNIIPKPQTISLGDGTPFELSRTTAIHYPAADSALARQAAMLGDYISEQLGFNISSDAGANVIALRSNLDNDNEEAFDISVTPDSIIINGASHAGTFYGVQTLRKAIGATKADKVMVPQGNVASSPRFTYRGMHLDVVRHFFPIDSVKEYIDMLALHNVNKLHWHLTDDQGWRIEIKSRPRLTEVGSKRPATEGSASYMLFDSIPQDGYYTKEELIDVVRYAADRYIDIVPEVDLPGHMQAALASYPELGCTGGPYKVTDCWSVGESVLCLGKEETYRFLDDIFTELVEIFPYEIIHIGGDECPREIWKNCKVCQAEADRLGFKDDAHGTREAKLQNHAMHHVAEFLRNNGRRVIGWDEVLDSDFAEDAVVMSWRGEKGGIEGARRGHDVIMTPTSYLYFDYYQFPDLDNEPLALGSLSTIENVYSYDPVPSCLTEAEKKHILGAQANVWAEYIPTFKQVQYMTLPRMAALSEVQWISPDEKDISAFTNRLGRLIDIYNQKGWRYADHIYNVHGDFEADSENNTLKVKLSTHDNAPVRYTTDGSEPTLSSPLYQEPITLKESCTLQAAAERNGKLGRIYRTDQRISKALFRPVELSEMPTDRYTFEGPQKLTDGRLGTCGYADTLWLGFLTPKVAATVDLGKADTVSRVSFLSNVNTIAWIFGARNVAVELSDDGINFRRVASEEYPVIEEETKNIVEHAFEFAPLQARFVRLNIGCEPRIPDWHPGHGNPSYFFIDEICVY